MSSELLEPMQVVRAGSERLGHECTLTSHGRRGRICLTAGRAGAVVGRVASRSK